MQSKNIKTRYVEKFFLKTLTNLDVCKVSKASAEIMLDRICNGDEIDFPYSQ